MKLFAPGDSLMRLVREITSLRMEPGSSSDEFDLLVRGTYRRFNTEAKRTCPPDASLHSFSREQMQVGTYEAGFSPDFQLEFHKEDSPGLFIYCYVKSPKKYSQL